ncbi:MAG: protein phosphatase 2C domain-containing protein [Patescibacteria group bacterium]
MSSKDLAKPAGVVGETDENQGHGRKGDAIIEILSEVESPAMVTAISEGMDLIRSGLDKVARDFFRGDVKKLGKHKKQVADITRQELYGFLLGQGLGENRADAILSLYLMVADDPDRKNEGKGKERTGAMTEMAVECENVRHGDDAYFMLPDKNAFGVFDGVSAATKGAEAARITATRAEEMFIALQGSGQKTAEEIKRAIHDMLIQVSRELASLGTNHETYQTTASIAYIHEEKDGRKQIIVGNAGDSRVYVFRQGALRQITLDDGGARMLVEADGDETRAREVQSILNNAVSVESLTEEQQKMFRTRNRIHQALGYDNGGELVPRMYIADVAGGDIVFVSSDGIHDPLTDNEMEEILRGNKGKVPDEIAKKFIEAVRTRNQDDDHMRRKPDDRTILVVRVQ